MIRSRVVGVGAYLPARVVDNDELACRLDTSDAWIRERTGITRRHLAAEDELTSDLAVQAARRALERASTSVAAIEAIVVATSTPDHTFPATATAVQQKLGAPIGIALDVQAVCAGFAYALAIADSFLRVGHARTALVIGAETFSRLLDWNDRSTAVLFGDGAGAVVLRAERSRGDLADRGVLATRLAADGRHYRDLYVDGGPSATRTTGHLRMNGREVFRHAVARLAESVEAVLAETGLAVADLDLLVPHQANLRIIEAVGRRLGLPPEKTIVTVDRHANTSAASIPLALDVALEDGRLADGRLLVVNALGGGFAWGAALIRW
ncbi:MAG: ketoacyl-ACP synthase III [Geminicoccaceae bacterium]|nr:ketoacyl-ACP synthase III [Geminicoccaceae bacterium]MCX8099804.1 ketoacyl-ACP synthase III [Geminicoccaceae bacterium]MDW8368776.1 beta-ketoacyl-ACP synthase III [Geminicoccaceae bacterium]